MRSKVLRGQPQWQEGMKIGIVTSCFNREITALLEEGAWQRLQELGVPEKALHMAHVPGAYEIPLAAKWMIEKMGCQAVLALGAVIRGDTSHFDYVCQAVERGCTTLQLKTGCPIVFGVLTTENEEQARERAGGSMGHKGREAADVAMEMLDLKLRMEKNYKKNNEY